jgi:hypothetical protein
MKTTVIPAIPFKIDRMKLLFYHKQTYTIDQPVEQVQTRLQWIVTRRWEDYSMDLVGRLYDGRNFSLRSKWTWSNIEWIDNNPGHIRGELLPEADRTRIRIITRPNKVLVGLFYFFLLLLLAELIHIEHILPFATNIKIAFLAGVNSVLLVLILLFRNGLKRRFEELMQLA